MKKAACRGGQDGVDSQGWWKALDEPLGSPRTANLNLEGPQSPDG